MTSRTITTHFHALIASSTLDNIFRFPLFLPHSGTERYTSYVLFLIYFLLRSLGTIVEAEKEKKKSKFMSMQV